MKRLILALVTLFSTFSLFAVQSNGIIYVKPGGTGTGTSWADALGDIQSAVTAATTPQKDVWVATGEFTISTNITLASGVNIIGSFAGTETEVNQRAKISRGKPWEFAHPTTLTGNGARLIQATAAMSVETAVDGFIMQNGNGVGSNTSGSGGGAMIRPNVIINNCIIKNNSCTGSGAGVMLNAGGIVRNTLIKNNTHTTGPNGGGGVFCSSSTTGIYSYIENCEITGNTSTIRGAGISVQGNITTYITACKIYNNQAIDGTTLKAGGSIYINSTANQITNCIIYNNSGSNTIYDIGGNLYNNTIVKNVGGLYLSSASNATNIANNILWGCATNATGTTATGVTGVANSQIKLDNNITYIPLSTDKNWILTNNLSFSSNTSNASGPVSKNVSSFIGAATTAEEIAQLDTIDWSLEGTSPCINTGKTLTDVITDIVGTARPQGNSYDIGAYEMYPIYFRSRTSGNWNNTTTWESSFNNSDWTLASIVPDSTTCFANILNGHLVTVTADATVSTATIEAGGQMTLNPGVTLSASSFTIESDATNGTGTFVNNGTLSATTSHVKQYLTGKLDTSLREWWYISSPVTGATSTIFDPAGGTNNIGYYDETTTSYQQTTSNGVALGTGKGYVVEIGGSGSVYTFTGSLNNGNISVPVTRTGTTAAKRGFNLIGNPYPSYLDWSQVDTTNILTTIWYRSYTGSSMVFDTYNGKTGVGINNSNTDNKLSNLIPPLQGFWVKVRSEKADLSGLTVDFTNDMRSHRNASTTGLLRASKAQEKTILRLDVSNGRQNDQTVVVLNENASNNFDDYDSPKMSNDNVSIPEIYTLAGSEQVAINGLKSIPANTELALGFKTGEYNNFTIKASEISNFNTDTKVMLKDKLTGKEQDLTDGSAYSFTSDAIATNDRFSIILRSADYGATDINQNAAPVILVSCNPNRQITVICNADIDDQSSISVYNSIGQKIAQQKRNGGSTEINGTFTPGVYIIAVNIGGQTVTKKLVVK